MFRFSLAALVALLPFASNAAPLPINEVVNRTTTSTSALVWDGLYDAFDGAFYLFNLGGLSVERDIATLTALNSYRVLDVFTNNTGATITTTVRNYTNLGSDGRETVIEEGADRTITHDRSWWGNSTGPFYDPVLAFTYGAGPGSAVEVLGDVSPGQFNMTFDLTLDAGESIGVLYYATLIRDNAGWGQPRSNDVPLATAQSQSFLDDPLGQSGLSAAQQATVANFSAPTPIPLPAGLPLMLTALGAALWIARKRKT